MGGWLGHLEAFHRHKPANGRQRPAGGGARLSAMNYSNLASRLTPRPPLNRDFLRRIARVRAASKRARTQAEKKAAFAMARP